LALLEKGNLITDTEPEDRNTRAYARKMNAISIGFSFRGKMMLKEDQCGSKMLR